MNLAIMQTRLAAMTAVLGIHISHEARSVPTLTKYKSVAPGKQLVNSNNNTKVHTQMGGCNESAIKE